MSDGTSEDEVVHTLDRVAELNRSGRGYPRISRAATITWGAGVVGWQAHTCYLAVDNITVDVPNPTPPPPTRATIAPLPPGATNIN